MPYDIATDKAISAYRPDTGRSLGWRGEGRRVVDGGGWIGDAASIAVAEWMVDRQTPLRPHPEMSEVYPADNDLYVVAVIRRILGPDLEWPDPPDESMFEWTEPDPEDST